MRKIIISGLVAATAVAAPAAAKPKPDKPDKPGKPAKCEPRAVGYHAKGALVSQDLQQTAGADTERRGDDRYGGTLTVDVAKANHKGATGEQTYAVEDARVRLRPRGEAPAAGDRVKVHGKVTRVGRKCADAPTPSVTVRKVDFKAKR